mmetsp:Transcript_57292/g.90848  ORF Transcript_57292/g.90848 Transcript_57292/m.90848 type:complete len:120 (+) Transcript_57292:134-493(+)
MQVFSRMLAFEILHAEANYAAVEILATQVCIASYRLHFKYIIINRQDTHVESATTQVVDKHVPRAVLPAHAKSNRSGSGFIYNAQDIQSTDQTCVFRCLALRIVEICRDCNDSVGDCAS